MVQLIFRVIVLSLLFSGLEAAADLADGGGHDHVPHETHADHRGESSGDNDHDHDREDIENHSEEDCQSSCHCAAHAPCIVAVIDLAADRLGSAQPLAPYPARRATRALSPPLRPPNA